MSGTTSAQPFKYSALQERLPPSQVRAASVLTEEHSVASVRFTSGSVRPLSARTATMLTGDRDQEFAPLDASRLLFANSITKTISWPSTTDSGSNVSQITLLEAEEPPRKRVKREKDAKHAKPGFRPSRPVKNAHEVYLDVWRLVLSFSSLTFLLEARTICKDFNLLLKENQSIWKTCRELEFGQHMPSPPAHLTERQYADLIVGKGCQSRSCPKRQTSKVYWPFRVRLCSSCFKQKTVKREEVQTRIRSVDNLTFLDLLPAAITKSGKYQGSRTFNTTTHEWDSTANSLLYLRRDFDKLEQEYLHIMQDTQKKGQISTWASAKLAEAASLMDQTHEIEMWTTTLDDDGYRYQIDRAQFYQDKAASLSPPISIDALQMFLAYQKAVAVNRDPTERSWQGLRSKIVPLQAEAEKLVQLDGQMQLFLGRPPSSAIHIFRRLHFHRSSRKHEPGILQPEQNFVLNIGKGCLSCCKDRGATDADLVLTCLQDVYDFYYDIPEECRPTGLNRDGTEGPYRLTLDDARMIVEDIIYREVETNSQRGAAVLQQFKCIACSRKDCTKKYTFQRGFEHILERHGKLVGEHHQYYKLFQPFPRIAGDAYFRFPWYTVEWPKCLPLVPGYFDITKDDWWDPEGSISYGPVDTRGKSRSAFEGRQAYDNPAVLPTDFTANLKWVAEALRKTKLNATCQTRIALKYALDRYNNYQLESPTLDMFADSIRHVQAVNPTLDFRFRCGICCHNDKIHRNSKYVKHTVPWHDLRKHWDNRQWHKGFVEIGGEDVLDWTTQMMLLPGDTELWDAMVRADEALDLLKEGVRKRKEKRGSVARMRGDAKAGVILGMEEALAVFDTIFVRME